ncbi:RluA family pseudouridine synthase [Novipirellula artificiosorum]|uniref:Ribosomal large subunit pseudouridine synthase A n=1 Tax=Novipirellula artificiosorum TaxID=2528016 RepID=A0A5C6E321_9BACT|nr:RluA family pseudouridine synthase [Novipirellula artificiosorum]TWU41786.1 Ribosomal large subunit pseudouridine synthase A [Novipirellula artificiosorum]
MKRLLIDPLPGRLPYENRRTIRVKAKFAGMRFIDFLCQYHPPTPRQSWLRWIDDGDIQFKSSAVEAARVVHAGDHYVHVMRQVTEPDVNASIGILHQDGSMVVVDKPAPLPIHPCGRFNRNSLLSMLQPFYPGEKLRLAHRLDANTTGVVLFCRTREAARFVQPQFERREVGKLYLTRVVGHVPWETFCCERPIANASEHLGHDTAGARFASQGGLPARTEFHVVGRLADQTTLLHAVPVTGRTNQIRVHLWSLGFPVLGDLLYRPGGVLGNQQTHSLLDPPLCLHAHRLSLTDPNLGQPVQFESPKPDWWQEPRRSHATTARDYCKSDSATTTANRFNLCQQNC